METITVQNLKCGGCQNTIRKGLESIDGVKVVHIDSETSSIDIEVTKDAARQLIPEKLHQMGYPLVGENNEFMDKAKSYVSCMIGRISD